MIIESYEIWTVGYPGKFIGVEASMNKALERAKALRSAYGECLVNFKMTCSETGLSMLPSDVREREAA